MMSAPVSGPAAAARTTPAFLHGVHRLLSSQHMLAWMDQAVVSAASFAMIVMIGRWTGRAELGVYATAMSLVALLLSTQESLVTRPYVVNLHRPLGTPAEHAFGTLMLSVLLAVVTAFGLSALALTQSALALPPELAAVSWALAAAVPFALTREFARRFSFAHLQVVHALWMDMGVAAVSVMLLGWLAWNASLSAVTGLAVVALSCGAGAVGWLWWGRRAFAFRGGHAAATLRENWRLGRWFLAGQLAVQAQGYIAYWLTLVMAGAAATGVYAACMSVVAFANPLLFGAFNLLMPRSVRAFRDEGGAGLRRQAVRDALLLALLMSGFSAVLFFLGDDVIQALYGGPRDAGEAHLIFVLALASLMASVGVPAGLALASTERVRAYAAVTGANALLNVVLVWWLMSEWGLVGAAYGVLAGEAVGSVARWLAFLALVPDGARVRAEPAVP
jgi:O-antigen/teichoic acid export membrane protein